MLLARVIGTVVASAKSERVEGQKMLIIQPLDLEGKASGGYVVAFDAVGAGAGEVVLFVTGSSARQTPATDGRPADATIFAIVDTWEVEGAVRYDKAAPEQTAAKNGSVRSARKR
jgi:microcompartment protein CcmK/EutM